MRLVADRQLNWLLCGGIGSGKSAVRGFFADHSVHTIDADSVGHEVLAPGGAAVADVAARWPEVLIEGRVERAALGRIVFADQRALRTLEAMTHPHIFSIIRDRVERREGPVVVEVPVLTQPFDPPWPRMVVDAPDELRVERAVARGLDHESVLQRMASQPTRGEWLAAADLVIPNSGDLGDLAGAVRACVEAVFGADLT